VRSSTISSGIRSRCCAASRQIRHEAANEFPHEFPYEFPYEFPREFPPEFLDEFPPEFPDEFPHEFLDEFLDEFPREAENIRRGGGKLAARGLPERAGVPLQTPRAAERGRRH
jgi:hypothetical protein